MTTTLKRDDLVTCPHCQSLQEPDTPVQDFVVPKQYAIPHGDTCWECGEMFYVVRDTDEIFRVARFRRDLHGN